MANEEKLEGDIVPKMKNTTSPMETIDDSAALGAAGMPFKVQSWLSTEESSDKASSVYSDGIYEVIEYDLDAEQDVEYLQEISIHKDSPAAAALRANAEVKVPAYSKAARAVHMQSVRRALKRARGGGNRKGKPPRAPPPQSHNSSLDQGSLAGEDISLSPMRNSIVPPGLHLDPLDESDDQSDDAASVAADVEPAAKEIVKPPPATETIEDVEANPIQLTAERADEESIIAPPENRRESMQFPVENITPGTVEAGKKVLGSVDPHDLLRRVRWRGKRPKKNKSYVKGKVIDGEHELYTLSIAVMIGVRTSISRTNTELNKGPTQRFVNMQDFRAAEKYEFRPKGGGPLPPHQLAHTFKFKDYSPMAFAYLRRMHGVNEFDFLLSVCGNANFIEFISNAKSGQFFFYSSDGRYMIKTMTNSESKFLRRILPQYFKHCCENPNTLVTRFFGMYRVKLYHLRRNVKFVIMNSVYHTDKPLQTFYDLKGSVIGRNAKPGQAVQKDNDLRKQLPDGALALRPKQRAALRGQLENDLKFLESIGIMDYSMLVGIHHIPAFSDRNNSATVSFRRNRQRRNTLSEDQQEPDSMVDVVPKSPLKIRPKDLATEIDDLEDDEHSYLEGTHFRLTKTELMNCDTERKKQTTIERLFWPFQHLYDIHGHRRWRPYDSRECSDCVGKKVNSVNGFKIPDFVKPLSERKDGGFEMDTTGIHLPLRAPDGTQYEGKIFYMGIIDILQEYNTRKSIESKYRYFRSSDPKAPSCVPPTEYAKRFLAFFDEYTERDMAVDDSDADEMGVEISERTC